MQKNVVSPATPCSGLQGIRVPCTSLQVNKPHEITSTLHLRREIFGPFDFVLMIIVNISVSLFRDLKEHLRRLQQQSDSRRRAAVMEMMRQRAAEVAGGSG